MIYSTDRKWAVIYRHTEDGKHILRISQTYATKSEAIQESQSEPEYQVILTANAIIDPQYKRRED